MKHRSPAAVFFLPFITFGIYSIVWQVKTKNEMNALGAEIPTAWLIIVPIANLYWLWKYSEGVEKVTGGKLSGVLSFVLQFLLSSIGQTIIQNEFNKVGSVAMAEPAAPTDDQLPGESNPFTPVEPTVVAAPEAATAPAAPPVVVEPQVIAPTTEPAPVTEPVSVEPAQPTPQA